MAFATASSAGEPLGEINTTPLIDVLLVLLIVLVMAVPLATNAIEIELPGESPPSAVDPIKNLIAIEPDGRLLWNGRAVDEAQLAGRLAQVRARTPEPEVQFRPDANASYERSAEVILMVKQSRISNFGFLGNEQYRTFGR